jgi:hypothetical protein
MITEKQILDLGAQWADAEVRGDTAALDAMTTDDFTLVGPVGFVLDKPQWLQRYLSGGLVRHSGQRPVPRHARVRPGG